MSDATAAFVGQSVTLPTGQIVTGKPLPFPQALACMDAFATYEAAATDTERAQVLRKMFADFTNAVDLQNAQALEALTLAEACDVVRSFFSYRRTSPPTAPSELT